MRYKGKILTFPLQTACSTEGDDCSMARRSAGPDTAGWDCATAKSAAPTTDESNARAPLGVDEDVDKEDEEDESVDTDDD